MTLNYFVISSGCWGTSLHTLLSCHVFVFHYYMSQTMCLLTVVFAVLFLQKLPYLQLRASPGNTDISTGRAGHHTNKHCQAFVDAGSIFLSPLLFFLPVPQP